MANCGGLPHTKQAIAYRKYFMNIAWSSQIFSNVKLDWSKLELSQICGLKKKFTIEVII